MMWIKKMKLPLFILIFSTATTIAQTGPVHPKLVDLKEDHGEVTDVDWLITHPTVKATVNRLGEKELVLANGLISRTIRVSPNAATVSLKNLVTREEYIRSVKPEALVVIDGVSYPIGGLSGQKEHGYFLSEWLDEMGSLENSFQLRDFEIKEISSPVQWKQIRWKPSLHGRIHSGIA